MQYTKEEFVDILAQHVPDPYGHAMRYFGLLAPRCKARTWAAIFLLLKQQVRPHPPRIRWRWLLKQTYGIDPLLDTTGAPCTGLAVDNPIVRWADLLVDPKQAPTQNSFGGGTVIITKRVIGVVDYNDGDFAEVQTIGIEGEEKDLWLATFQIHREDTEDTPHQFRERFPVGMRLDVVTTTKITTKSSTDHPDTSVRESGHSPYRVK